MTETVEERFWKKVNFRGPVPPDAPHLGRCWIWKAASLKTGYGVFRVGKGRNIYAHRMSYTLVEGEIPDGLTVDHLCWVPSCVRPNHLRTATMAEQAKNRRALVEHPVIRARRERGGKCIHGHGPEHLAYNGRRHYCRECSRINSRRWKHRQAGPRRVPTP